MKNKYVISMSFKPPKFYHSGDLIVKGDTCYQCWKPIEEYTEFVWVSEGLQWVVYHPKCKPNTPSKTDWLGLAITE